MKTDRTIIHVYTTRWGNPFARRALEQALQCDIDSPLRDTDWLIDYVPVPPGGREAVVIEGPALAADARNAIAAKAHLALLRSPSQVHE